MSNKTITYYTLAEAREILVRRFLQKIIRISIATIICIALVTITILCVLVEGNLTIPIFLILLCIGFATL